MPPRTFWKGFLKLSLVTCPVQLVPAGTSLDRVTFRTLNARTGHPVTSRWVDEGTGKPVDDDNRAKGYERGEGDYIILDDEDLDSVQLDSARTIDIRSFVPADSIGWLWYDRPHYLIPADPVGEEAFAVIRAAMEATATGGIAQLVLNGRERAVLLLPRGRGIVLWTLRYGDEVRDSMAYFDADDTPDTLPADQMDLMTRLIRDRTGDWDPALLDDPVQDDLRKLIASKTKGARKPRKPEAEDTPAPSNVVNIMDALRKSLAAESKGKGKRR